MTEVPGQQGPEQNPKTIPYDDWAIKYGKEPHAPGAPQAIRIAAFVVKEKARIFRTLRSERGQSLTDGIRLAVGVMQYVETAGPVLRKKNGEIVLIGDRQEDEISKYPSLLDNPDIAPFSVNVNPYTAKTLLAFTEKYGVSIDQAIEHAFDLDFEMRMSTNPKPEDLSDS